LDRFAPDGWVQLGRRREERCKLTGQEKAEPLPKREWGLQMEAVREFGVRE
jgi:hypothetical protein